MNCIIIDTGSGNLRSAAKSFERAADEVADNASISVSSKPEDIQKASHIVLPGVGAFGDCAAGLAATDGLLDALDEAVIEGDAWFLGICVGMQLMLDTGYEHGEHQGLGWIKGEVVKLLPPPEGGRAFKIPHMGWNELTISDANCPLLTGIENGDHAYFVHSYHGICQQDNEVLATTDYGQDIAAAIGRDNLFGTQFHPEKSQAMGLKLIGNFLNL